MIVLKTPKGWTGPKVVDGLPVEGTYRAHQVPLSEPTRAPRAPEACSKTGCGATGPRSSSTRRAGSSPSWPRSPPRATAGWAPTRTPTAASCSATCACPTSATTPSTCPRPAPSMAEDTRTLGKFLRDVIKLNAGPAELPHLRPRRDRLQPPGPPSSRRPTGSGTAEIIADRRPPRRRRPRHGDAQRAPVRGLARGLPAHRPPRPLQLLRGVHPHHRFDVQPARQVAEGDAGTSPGGGRSPRSTILLTSHVWRQDHNGFTHQDPGFIDHVVNKKAEIIRVYLPPDANCLLSVMDHCLRSRHYVNVIVGEQAPVAAVARHGRGRQALHGRHRHLGVGEQRQGRRARRRHGLRRRRAHARDAGRRRSSSASTSPT